MIYGTAGITFYIQSEKVDPDYLLLRVLDFIDNFYFNTLDESLFNDWKKGLIDKKKSRFSSIEQEASSLAEAIFDWSLESGQKIDWA